MHLMRQFVPVALALGLLAAVPACTGQSADDSRTRQPGDAAAAPVPQFVNFAGTLKSHNGQPASGVVGITFLLYEEEEGGSPLWRETQNVTLDAEGRYSVALGAATPYGMPAELFTAKQARWLAIEPQGLPAPARIMLLSVPYALKAGDAETIGGLPPSAFMLAGAALKTSSADSQSSPALASPETMTGSGTTNYIPRWTPNGTTLGNSTLFQSGSGSTAKVGVNTSTPAATLDVNGGLIARGSVQLLNTGTATAAKGWTSQPLTFLASAFDSSTQKAFAPKFQWQAEAQGNNTATPGATLNLLYGTAVTPAETGLKIARNGQITFASGQTFPGTGTLTGITAGSGLTGGGTKGNPTLAIDSTKVPFLGAANKFTAPITFAPGQTFPGTGNGTVTGITAGAGLTGGGSTGNLTLGVDSTKVPLLSAANTFTAPITFASGQTFPGTGTLTGITPGTGLTGGGTTGNPTLSVDATKVPLLASANTFAGKITFASGQTFPGTVTSVTAGTGLSGGGSGNPTLGVDATKVPLLGAPNTFTAPITFASGQTFPGTGTLTGITPGTGLTGGGTTGNPTLGIDSSLVPFLSAANTFTGAQTINIPTCPGLICRPPSYLLHSMGTIRSETGLSLGDNAFLRVDDASGTTGGHFVVETNGNVGINNPNPSTTLDVGGNVNVGGSLTIQGDTAMNAAPHMYLTGYVPGPLSANYYTLPIFTIPTKNILITRAVAFGLSTCPSEGALIFEIQTLPPGSQTLSNPYNLDFATGYPVTADSGPLSISIAAGTQLYGYIYTPNCGSFGTAPSQLTVSIEYVMQ